VSLIVNQDIQQQIVTLHQRLGMLEPESLDARTRELLLLLLNDLTRLLSSPRAETEYPLTERLEAVALRFEAEHPAVGTAVRQLIDALGKAGI